MRDDGEVVGVKGVMGESFVEDRSHVVLEVI